MGFLSIYTLSMPSSKVSIHIDDNDYGHFIDTETMQYTNRISRYNKYDLTDDFDNLKYKPNFSNTYALVISVITIGATVIFFEFMNR
jgi:hypothetical protein